jgi:hypothetical protein
MWHQTATMRSQKTKRVSREDIKTIATAIAKEIAHWCYHHHGNVRECLMQHVENPDSYSMYVPKEYEKLYERVLRSRRKTAALDRAVKARLRKVTFKVRRRSR